MATNYPGALDSWTNPGPTNFEDDPSFYHDVMHSNHNDAIEAIEGELGVNPSGTYATVAERLGAYLSPVYTPVGTPTYADEFTSAALDSGWVHVYPTGKQANVTWTQTHGVLSAYHAAASDGASNFHGLMRSSGTFANGDAIVTRLHQHGPTSSNYSMGGLILSTNNVYGAGTQIFTLNFISSSAAQTTNDLRVHNNWNSQVTGATGNVPLSQQPTWVRLVRLTATTWRADTSYDGISWRLGSANLTAAYEPAYMGLLASSWDTTTSHVLTYDCFRRYSGVT